MKKILKLVFWLLILSFLLACGFIASGYYTLHPKPYLNYAWDNIVFPETVASELASKNEFSILSFNAGLLDLRIHGETKLMPTAFIEERTKKIPSALLAEDADVIALQEVYEKEHIDFLIRELKSTYPHYFFQHNSRLKLNNGLMLFSKYPLLDRKGMSQDEKGPFDEAWLADRSLISSAIEVNGKRISIVNLHATSGGTLYAQDDDNINQARQKQLQKAIDLANTYQTDYQIILGDMNAGPTIAPSNHQHVLSQGYVDAHGELIEYQKTDKSNSTWDGGNPLNAMRGYDASIQQRIDLIYLSDALKKAVELTGAQQLYSEDSVKIDEQLSVPLSDHYGVIVNMRFD